MRFLFLILSMSVKYLISLLNTYVNDVMKRYKERDKKKLEKKNHDLNQ